MLECLYLSDEWAILVLRGWVTLTVDACSLAVMAPPEGGISPNTGLWEEDPPDEGDNYEDFAPPNEWADEEPEYGPYDGGFWEPEPMDPYDGGYDELPF